MGLENLGIGIVIADADDFSFWVDDCDTCADTFQALFFPGVSIQRDITLDMQHTLSEHEALTGEAIPVAMNDGMNALLMHVIDTGIGQRPVVFPVFGAHRIGEWAIVKIRKLGA